MADGYEPVHVVHHFLDPRTFGLSLTGIPWGLYLLPRERQRSWKSPGGGGRLLQLGEVLKGGTPSVCSRLVGYSQIEIIV